MRLVRNRPTNKEPHSGSCLCLQAHPCACGPARPGGERAATTHYFVFLRAMVPAFALPLIIFLLPWLRPLARLPSESKHTYNAAFANLSVPLPLLALPFFAFWFVFYFIFLFLVRKALLAHCLASLP